MSFEGRFMIYYDVFNGDADGILSLIQLRQLEPRDSNLITGVKRDINLLKKVPVDDSKKQITVLDVSMEKNIAALTSHLKSGTKVLYADHHRSGEIPSSPLLNAHIDLSSDTCTALIIDKLLQGKKRLWAIAAAYGDNLIKKADQLANETGLTDQQASQLREFGTLVNYNGYGETLDDLHFNPADIFKQLYPYSSPFDCIEDPNSVFNILQGAYQEDYKKAKSSPVVKNESNILVLELESAAWARRISGVYGNELANDNPDKAIVVLTKNEDATYRVSLRAPINNKQKAGDICSNFETGGGREAAGGVNSLPSEMLDMFLGRVKSDY
jgi:hypothetical protein